MEEKLKVLTFVMVAIGALYAFDGLSQGAFSANSVTGLAVSDERLARQDVSCFDSDNRNYGIQGVTYAKLFAVNGEAPKHDMCQGNTLIEYYCVASEPQVEFYDCPGRCISGRCV